MTRPILAIVGGGLSGAALAWQLLRKANRPLEVWVVDGEGPLGAGVAYRTNHPGHLLNVRTGAMSLDPDDPDHLVRWLDTDGRDAARRWNASLDPDGFLPRGMYREYVDHSLQTAMHEAKSGTSLKRVDSHAMGVYWDQTVAGVLLADGSIVTTMAVVLAIGNPEPAHPTGDDLPFYSSARYIRDPWSEASISAIDRNDHVLVLGSNLTMADVAVSLATRDHRGEITAISRHGLISATHGSTALPGPGLPPSSAPRGLRGLVSEIRRQVREEAARGTQDWRAIVDALRPDVPRIWRGFSEADRRRFVRHVRPYWEVHRHRAPQEVMRRIDALRESGRLTFRAGRVCGMEEKDGRVSVTFLPRGARSERSILVDRVVNATGPESDYRRVDDPLLRQLFTNGGIRPGPLGMGLDAEEDGAIVDAQGHRSRFLSTLGPTLRGTLWETTAVPEIRVQARALAERLLHTVHG